jgi:hypothetical protein
MSARDSASGSSDWHGGGSYSRNSGGGAQNGGIGGGQGGGQWGGGAGYNGGFQSQQGIRTGATMQGTSAYGRPGGMAQGYGMNPAQARQAAMQGIMGRLQGQAQPTGAQPPQSPPPLPTSAWLKAYGNINSPIATGYAYDPATSPAAYNPLASMMPRAPTMQDYPQFQNSPMPGGPGNIKNSSRLPGDHPFASGQNWGNPGAGSMGLGSSGGGRAGGGGRGW